MSGSATTASWWWTRTLDAILKLEYHARQFGDTVCREAAENSM